MASGGVRFRVWGAALLLALAMGVAHATQPVAMLTDLKGQVEYAADKKGRIVTLAAALHTDDALQLGAGARVVVAYPNSGQVFEVVGPGVVRIGDADLHSTQGARVARSELPPQMRGLVKPGRATQASAVQRGLHTRDLMPIAPRGAQLASHARVLRWQPMLSADGTIWDYYVRLIDEAGVVVYSTHTRAPEVTLPADLRLQRNHPYIWSVEARGPYGRRHESAAEFKLVDAAVERALIEARPAVEKSQAARSVYLIALWQHGLTQAAESFGR